MLSMCDPTANHDSKSAAVVSAREWKNAAVSYIKTSEKPATTTHTARGGINNSNDAFLTPGLPLLTLCGSLDPTAVRVADVRES